MKNHFIAGLIFFFTIGASLLGNEKADIARRMQERLPRIDALKEQQGVGENNLGLLEARGQITGDDATVIESENKDRGVIYEAIAKDTGSTSTAVGAQRARKIADNSKPGVWLEDPTGRWYRK